MTIKCSSFHEFDATSVPSPCFVVDEAIVERNLKLLADVANRSGARILLALKAFAMHELAPLIDQYLHGVCASGLHEATLGREAFKGTVHTYSPAYKDSDINEILTLSDHVIFNTPGQWQRFKTQAIAQQKQRPELKFGLRINPEHSEGTTEIYDPCAPGSRLGTPLSALGPASELEGISGLHFHTLCEQLFEPLDRTLDVIEDKFADLLQRVDWVNFGGGHHITAPGYDIEGLVKRIRAFSERYDVQVYLEPGEAIAIHSGVLVAEVLDVACFSQDVAILDTSATCHMPDTLEMPYRAEIFGAGLPGEKPYAYRLGGGSCLAGDVMGDYTFDAPLTVGQRLLFDDMAHYTMVKTTTFNGVALPAIALWHSTKGDLRIVKKFGYTDFRDRLS